MHNSLSTDDSTCVSGMSDDALIQEFVSSVLRGDNVLHANRDLRVEPVMHSLQLLSKKEGLLASVNVKKLPLVIDVRGETEYWSVIHAQLIQESYLPSTHKIYPKTFRYQYCPSPAGYQICCSNAKELWRVCWGRGFGLRHGIPLDLLVWAPSAHEPKQNAWQALRGMDCDLGKLEIKLLGHKYTLDGQDLVVWAKNKPQESRIPAYSHGLGLRHRRY